MARIAEMNDKAAACLRMLQKDPLRNETYLSTNPLDPAISKLQALAFDSRVGDVTLTSFLPLSFAGRSLSVMGLGRVMLRQRWTEGCDIYNADITPTKSAGS